MREVKLNAREHAKFLEIMEKRMSERDISIEQLANELGIAKHSLYNFRTDRSRNPSRFVAGKVATYLEIKPGEWRR